MEKYCNEGYQLTDNPSFQDEKHGVDSKLKKLLTTSLFYEANDPNNKNIIERLTDLIIENPKTPELKNYLSVAYHKQNNYEKSLEVNKWIRSEHPDYLYGMLNEVYDHIKEERVDAARQLLGTDLSLKKLYPERALFLFVEFTSYYRAVVVYYLATDDLEKARAVLKFMQEYANYEEGTIQAITDIIAYEKITAQQNRDKRMKFNVHLKKVSQTKEEPVFNHPEIKWLYEYGFEIEQKLLSAILELPHQTLIDDLELVLLDAEKRYDYFLEGNFLDEQLIFPIHAINLLVELESVESLSKIISLLYNDDAFLDFWFDNIIAEDAWVWFYKLGKNKLNILEETMMMPGMDTYVKASASNAVNYLIAHKKVSEEIGFKLYENTFNKILIAKEVDNVIDVEFFAFMICDVIELKFAELLPLIKACFEKKYVETSIAGSYDELVDDIENKRIDCRLQIPTLMEMYEVGSSFSNSFEDAIFINDTIDSRHSVVNTIPKVGRNEPCPCGSGNKYKRCHGKNN